MDKLIKISTYTLVVILLFFILLLCFGRTRQNLSDEYVDRWIRVSRLRSINQDFFLSHNKHLDNYHDIYEKYKTDAKYLFEERFEVLYYSPSTLVVGLSNFDSKIARTDNQICNFYALVQCNEDTDHIKDYILFLHDPRQRIWYIPSINHTGKATDMNRKIFVLSQFENVFPWSQKSSIYLKNIDNKEAKDE